MTLILQTFPASFGMPSASPFCTKVMCLLRMGGLEWTADDKADVRKAPKQKFPVLLDGAETIPDSAAICAYLAERHGCDFDGGLSDAAKAQNHALVRMVEEHLYFALYTDRWLVDSHWEKLREAYFNELPFGLRQLVPGFVRRDVNRSCRGQGMARHTVPEMAARVQLDLECLATALGDREYFNSDVPTIADASIAPMLDSLHNPEFQDGICRHLTLPPVLLAYIARCQDSIFPSEDVYRWRA